MPSFRYQPYTSANTIIIGTKAQQPPPDEIENRWNDAFYDNRPVEILLVRIGP